jgi:RNA polymerase sigma-70 factor (ECF subfamily)
MDYESFGRLTTPHATAMVHVAAALVGRADAEDAVQEALVRAWRAWPSLRDAGAARAWLLRITVNVCRNWQAGHFGTHQRSTEPLNAADAPTPHPALVGCGPGDSGHAVALDLRSAVRQLPEELRQIVALRFYAGMDSTEIGAALDLPPPTVRTRLRRALVQLRQRLGASDDPTVSDTLRLAEGG